MVMETEPNPTGHAAEGEGSAESLHEQEACASADKKEVACDLPDKLERPQCHVCGKTLCSKWSLRKHLRTHTREKPYSCPFCPRTFRHDGSLNVHKETHTGEGRCSCDVCGKTVSRRQLKRHLRIHSEEKPYEKERRQCHVCKKLLCNISSLKMHLVTHSDGRPFSCPFCSKTFRHHNSLHAHKRKHTGEGTSSCDVCGKAINRGGMKRHVMSHAEVKPYECSVCGAKFSQKNSLKYHLYIHTDEKPYPCQLCPRAFRSVQTLRAHERKHKGVQQLMGREQDNTAVSGFSNVCGMPSGQETSLTDHKLTPSAEEDTVAESPDSKTEGCVSLWKGKAF